MSFSVMTIQSFKTDSTIKDNIRKLFNLTGWFGLNIINNFTNNLIVNRNITLYVYKGGKFEFPTEAKSQNITLP